MIDILYSEEDVMNAYGVRTHRVTKAGFIAIRKLKHGKWLWMYFRKVDDLYFEIVGSLPYYDENLFYTPEIGQGESYGKQ